MPAFSSVHVSCYYLQGYRQGLHGHQPHQRLHSWKDGLLPNAGMSLVIVLCLASYPPSLQAIIAFCAQMHMSLRAKVLTSAAYRLLFASTWANILLSVTLGNTLHLAC